MLAEAANIREVEKQTATHFFAGANYEEAGRNTQEQMEKSPARIWEDNPPVGLARQQRRAQFVWKPQPRSSSDSEQQRKLYTPASRTLG
jgi:hypothetical protein